jgi:dihydroflavonol-4-reductase
VKVFVTGGTGFIGGAVARALAARGDDVRVLVPPAPAARRARRAASRNGAPRAADLPEGVKAVSGELRDRRALRRALDGVDRVFHAAGLQGAIGDPPGSFEPGLATNRLVLEECRRAEVERVVVTSSYMAVGPAGAGQTTDEGQLFTAGRLGIPLVAAYREAEIEAFRAAAAGLPVVCVNPCVTLGAGDEEGRATAVVRRFLLGRVSFYAGGAVNVVGIDDVARGHLLADERGKVGERYLLGNRNYTLTRFFADLSRLSGVPEPAQVPLTVALGLTQTLDSAPGRTAPNAAEMRMSSHWWTYRTGKARRELGWSTSPHEDTVEATVAWYRERLGERLAAGRGLTRLPLRVAGRSMAQAAGVAGRLRRRLG